MDLLERAELFQQLQNAFAEVTQGQGRLALVYGEAGIGKTSLVEQFVQAQEKQTRVLWGSCDALFTPRPLGPLYDVAQQIRGEAGIGKTSLVEQFVQAQEKQTRVLWGSCDALLDE